MNEVDRDAFEEWYESSAPEWKDEHDKNEMFISWEGACEHKQREVVELKMRIARLENVVIECRQNMHVHFDRRTAEASRKAGNVLNESPAQSRAEVEAETLRKFGDKLFAEQILSPDASDFARLAHEEASRVLQEVGP